MLTGQIRAFYCDHNDLKRGDDLQDNIPQVPVPGITWAERAAMIMECYELTWEGYRAWKNQERPVCESD